jgi:ATP-dependent RNA helicase RhlE
MTELRDIQKLIGKKIPVESNHPYHIDINQNSAHHAPKKPQMQQRPNRPGNNNRNQHPQRSRQYN